MFDYVRRDQWQRHRGAGSRPQQIVTRSYISYYSYSVYGWLCDVSIWHMIKVYGTV